MMLRVFSLFLISALATLAGDLNGKWLAKVAGPNGELEVTYVLKVDAGKITGTASSHMGEMKITEGTVTADDVVFILNVNMNGEERKVEHKGKLAGDDLNMTIVINEQTMEIKAKRSAS